MRILKNYNYENISKSIESWISGWEQIKNERVDVKTEWFICNISRSVNEFIEQKKIKISNEFFDDELEQMRLQNTETEYIRRRNFLMIVIVTTNGNNTDNTEKLVYCVHRRCFSVTIHGMFCVCTCTVYIVH